MKKLLSSSVRFLLCMPALLLMTGVLHADTVFSENFNEVTPGLGVATAGAFQAIDGTNVDVVGGALFGNLCSGPESGNCVDMGGTGGKNPSGNIDLMTALNLAPGTYYLSFDLIGSQRDTTTTTTVNFGPYSQTFTLGPEDFTSGIVTDQAVVWGGGNIQLQFTDNSPANNIGALLDNITVTTTPAPVPEPESLVLLATGLLGGAGLLRRKFFV
ncbi:hypothetical protein GCM10011507_09150 [Edaphobacter acidisoli]|uniref:Ice-binding protein C-terminal domain-containing protein n=1 Tax=Edaphobacter acidisoli TaxID=2040573 RepID=A0A916W231_9BACT|nr:PEP-CTERM sorting domain-containing protein [Edaphobacter acidisoli]GGA59807.1 hypothetical protein GCM10011507_09150 [Edaphobacter acidisoli]